MEKLKIGVLGCANIARKAVIPAIKSIDELELVAVASRSKDKAEDFGKEFSCDSYSGYYKLIDDDRIQIVYIPLPTGLHEEWIIKAFNSGKHVFVEKSMSIDYKSAERIINKAQKQNLLIMEDYMFQHHSQHEFVKKLIDDGEVGKVNFLKACFGFPPLPFDNFRYNARLGGGVLLDAAGYPLKAAQLFLEPELSVVGSTLIYDKDLDVDIYGGACLTNSLGQIAQISFSFNNYYQCNYEIWGEKGKITVERAYTPPPTLSPKVILEKQDYHREFNLNPDNHFIKILRYFVQEIQGKNYQEHWDDIVNQARLQQSIRDQSVREE